ncbi:hypothetical protein [Rahnella rivi]|uniref:hypothetical protein n=1 Tax=Rahnella rivi TaxID=2816249 RepID=UPI0039BEB0DB
MSKTVFEQRAVNESQNPKPLASFMDQVPEFISVGEMRDWDYIHAAKSGHLVLYTPPFGTEKYLCLKKRLNPTPSKKV